jgi:hypothetical protein
MAKITYDPDEGPLEAEVFARTKGAVHIQCHDDEDNKKATSALESAGMKVFLPYAEVTKAQCCLTLNAEDLKFLQENPTSYFVVNNSPFSIMVQFEETTLDYLERTFTTPTPKA